MQLRECIAQWHSVMAWLQDHGNLVTYATSSTKKAPRGYFTFTLVDAALLQLEADPTYVRTLSLIHI